MTHRWVSTTTCICSEAGRRDPAPPAGPQSAPPRGHTLTLLVCILDPSGVSILTRSTRRGRLDGATRFVRFCSTMVASQCMTEAALVPAGMAVAQCNPRVRCEAVPGQTILGLTVPPRRRSSSLFDRQIEPLGTCHTGRSRAT